MILARQAAVKAFQSCRLRWLTNCCVRPLTGSVNDSHRRPEQAKRIAGFWYLRS